MQNFDTYQERYERRLRRRMITIVGLFILLVVCTTMLVRNSFYFRAQIEREMSMKKIPMAKSHTRLTDQQWELSQYFQKIGSPEPQKMAIAVSMTKKPRLMAAMAKVETRANPHKRRTGYKKRYHGAWQVDPKHWGRVSSDPIEQALQAQDALEDLVRTHNGNFKRGLNNYGGDSTDNYSKKILAELVNVP
jgi:hypothetical protein